MPKENRRVSRKEADRNQFKNKFLRHLSLVSIKLFSLLFSQAKNTWSLGKKKRLNPKAKEKLRENQRAQQKRVKAKVQLNLVDFLEATVRRQWITKKVKAKVKRGNLPKVSKARRNRFQWVYQNRLKDKERAQRSLESGAGKRFRIQTKLQRVQKQQNRNRRRKVMMNKKSKVWRAAKRWKQQLQRKRPRNECMRNDLWTRIFEE